MNRDEHLAESYLKSLGYKNIVFEPNGNVPPDFLVDSKIAVEVRRLNQHFFTENDANGLEENRIPLFKLFESCLREFDNEYRGNSYWISVRFKRPIGDGKSIKKALNTALSNFLNEENVVPCDINITKTITITISESTQIEGKIFRFAGGIDRNAGGWVISEFKDNFDHCVAEKQQKILDYFSKYTTWWLILVDNIALEFDDEEKSEIKSSIRGKLDWNKIVVLNSNNGRNILEI